MHIKAFTKVKIAKLERSSYNFRNYHIIHNKPINSEMILKIYLEGTRL